MTKILQNEKTHHESRFPRNKSSFNQIHYRKKSPALIQCLEEDLPTREKSFPSPSSHSRNSNKIWQPELACTEYNWGTYSLNPGGFNKGNIETNLLTDQKKVYKNECCSENIECNELCSPEEFESRIRSVCSDQAIWDWDSGGSDDSVNPSAQNVSLKQTIGLQSEEHDHSLSSPRFLNASFNVVPPNVTEVQNPTAALRAAPVMCPPFNDQIHILRQIPGFTPASNPIKTASLICIKPFTPIPAIPVNTSEKNEIEMEMEHPPIKAYPTITFACEHILPEEPKELNNFNFIPTSSSKHILEKFSTLYKLQMFQVPLAKESTSCSPNGPREPKMEEIRTSGFLSAEKDNSKEDSNSQSEVGGEEDVYKKVGEILLTGLKHSCLPKGFIYNEPTKVTPTLKNCCLCRKSPEKAGKGKKPTSISWEDEETLDSNDEQGLQNKGKTLIGKKISIGKIFPASFPTNPCFLESCHFPKTPCTSPIPNMNRRIEFRENLLHQDSSQILTTDGDETISPFLKLPNKDCHLCETTPDSKTQSEISFEGKNSSSGTEIIAYPCTHSHTYSLDMYRPCPGHSGRSRSNNLSRSNSPRSKKTRRGSADEETVKTIEICASVQLIPFTTQDDPIDNLSDCCPCPNRKTGSVMSTSPTPSQGYQYRDDYPILPAVNTNLSQIQPHQDNQQRNTPGIIVPTNFLNTRPYNDANGFSGLNSGSLQLNSPMQQAHLQQGQLFQPGKLQQAQLEKGLSQQPQPGQLQGINAFQEKGISQQPQSGQPQGTIPWQEKGLSQQPQSGQLQGTTLQVQSTVSEIQDNQHSPLSSGSQIDQTRSKTIRTLYSQKSRVNFEAPQHHRCHSSPKRHKTRRSSSPHSHRMLPNLPQRTEICYGPDQSSQTGKCPLLGQCEAARCENNLQQLPSVSRCLKNVCPNYTLACYPVGKCQAEGQRFGKCAPKMHEGGNLISQNQPIFKFPQPYTQTGVNPYAAQMGNFTSQANIMGGAMPRCYGQQCKTTGFGNIPTTDDHMNFNSQAYKSDSPNKSSFPRGPNNNICVCCKRPLDFGFQNSDPKQLFQQPIPFYSQPNQQSTSVQTETEQNSKGVQVSLTRAPYYPSYNRGMESTMNQSSRHYPSKRRFDGCQRRRSPNNCSVLFIPVCCNNLDLQEPDNCCECVVNNNDNCCDCNVRNCVVVKSCNQPKNKIHNSICNSMLSGAVAYETLPPSVQFCDPNTQPSMNPYQSSSLRSGNRMCSGSVNPTRRSVYNTSALSKPFILTFPATNCQQDDNRPVGFIQNLRQNGSPSMGFNNLNC
ncbi:unnamed protein product [Allacma fusca]|uniref:Uncharacterized protein n=1 Tax=Allacma fusca TaxID=39272 RepID=A0A8J2JSU0_9HEXA|nr:unnamed protein product [Allacma fusca]